MEGVPGINGFQVVPNPNEPEWDKLNYSNDLPTPITNELLHAQNAGGVVIPPNNNNNAFHLVFSQLDNFSLPGGWMGLEYDHNMCCGMLWHRLRLFDEDIMEELEDKCGDTEYLPQRNGHWSGPPTQNSGQYCSNPDLVFILVIWCSLFCNSQRALATSQQTPNNFQHDADSCDDLFLVHAMCSTRSTPTPDTVR